MISHNLQTSIKYAHTLIFSPFVTICNHLRDESKQNTSLCRVTSVVSILYMFCNCIIPDEKYYACLCLYTFCMHYFQYVDKKRNQ